MELKLKKVNDRYLLEHTGHSGITIEVDGKRIKDFKQGWIKERPNSIKLITNKTKVVKYGDLTPEEYEGQLALLKPSVDDEDEYHFTSLEQEYAYKKFIQEHKPEYETYEDITDVDLIEYDITGRTDNPFIIPFRFIGHTGKQEEALYRYISSPYQIAQMVAKELGFEEVEDVIFGNGNTEGMKWSCSKHDRDELEYLKINGEYCGIKNGRFCSVTCGTYEECEQRYNEQLSTIRNVFQQALRKINAQGMKYDKAGVIKELEVIGRLVDGVHAKKSGIQTYQVRERISKLIKDL